MKQINSCATLTAALLSILVIQNNMIFTSDSDLRPFFRQPSQIDLRALGLPSTSMTTVDPFNSMGRTRPETRQAQRGTRLRTISPRAQFPEGDFEDNDPIAQQYRKNIASGLSAAQVIELESILPEPTIFAEPGQPQEFENMTPPESMLFLRETTRDPQNHHNLRRRHAIADDNDEIDSLATTTQSEQTSVRPSPAHATMTPLLAYIPTPPSPRAQLIRNDPLLAALQQQRQDRTPAATIIEGTTPLIPQLRPTGSYRAQRRGGVVDEHHNTLPNVSPQQRTQVGNAAPLPNFTDTDSSDGSEFTIEEDIFNVPPMHRTDTVPFGNAILEYRALPKAAPTTFTEPLQLPAISIEAQRRGGISMPTTPPQPKRHIRTPRPDEHALWAP